MISETNINIRISDRDKLKYEQLADERGLKFSPFIRDLIRIGAKYLDSANKKLHQRGNGVPVRKVRS